MRRIFSISLGSAIGLAALATTMPAHASLIDDGITYSLTETTLTATSAQFTLGISGINGPSDTEGGRFGVNALAFTQPANFSAAGAPTGFTSVLGGLNSGGCDMAGNFFCFSANTTPTGPALAANSSLSFVFTETISSGSFAGYVPDFKIDWVGTKNNYDLVSLPLPPTPGRSVPEPNTLLALGAGLLGLVLLRRRWI